MEDTSSAQQNLWSPILSVLRLENKLVARLDVVAVELLLSKAHLLGPVGADHVLVDVEEALARGRDAERLLDDLLELKHGHVDADGPVRLGAVELDRDGDLRPRAEVDVYQRVELAVDGE